MSRGLTLPVIDLSNEIQHPYSASTNYHTAKLFSQDRQLLISARELVMLRGSTVFKKLSYEDDIVSATFTTFKPNNQTTTSAIVETPGDALTVCLRKSAHIYYPDGRVYSVMLPFPLKNAFAYESGLVLEKDQNQPNALNSSQAQQLNASKFLTLVDPIGDFRVVTTSSTSVISRHEELLYFPKKGINKTNSLCATFNTQESTVVIYHVRSATRNTKRMNSSAPKYSKRKQSLAYTPNPSRILEDEILMDSSSNANNSSINQNVLSVNMEKKRTSTLLSDVSSIARMSTDPGISDHSSKKKNQYNITNNSSSHHQGGEYPVLKKDMILSKVDSLSIKVQDVSQIKVFGLHYDDQEALAVFNKQRNECRVYIFKYPSTGRSHTSYTISCVDCHPLNHDKFGGILVVLERLPGNAGTFLGLVNPFLDIVSPKIDLTKFEQPITGIEASHNEKLAISSKGGAFHMIRFVLEPMNAFVRSCLNCFKYLSGSKINETVWMLWRAALALDEDKNEWNAFVITLLSIIYPFKEGYECTENNVTRLLSKAKYLHEAYNVNYSLSDLIPYITLSLHLLREELRLDTMAKAQQSEVALLLAQLTTWMGWPDSWTQYYMIDKSNVDQEVRFLSILVLESPPNLFESLASLFSDKIIRYLTFSQLVEEADSIDVLITPRTHHILKLFEVIVSANYGPSAVIDLMCEYNITQGDLETYPPGICFPLKETISICQENPAFEWTGKALELVGRKDLSMFLSDSPHDYSVNSSAEVEVKSIGQVLSKIIDSSETISPWDGQSEADRIGITKLIFDYDRRYYEITTLLHQTKTQTATLVADSDISEYDLVLLQRELASLVALRTLTIPIGRAALFYAGRKPLLTEKFPIPKFNLNTLIAPTMTNIILSEGSINQTFSEWGSYHNGVSSGLSIDRAAKGISGSWIIFNKPPELNAQHAGFLMGLGLNGHLKKLEEWHIYNYLGPKHPLTSVGLLIGMAASIRGSMDNKLTKVLSVHAVALLPQGANDLNVPVMVQTAGLIGIGLLYLESQHRRMSEILLSQLTSSVYQSDSEQIHEGYRLAAGISLGFVNLGKGDDLRGLNDTHVVDKLLSLATSMKDYQPVQELDKSCCGAILALGFIYMRTENVSIANKLRVPDIEQLLDYIRPDFLLLRCVAKNLVMWNQIGNTVEWIESQFPNSLLGKYSNWHREPLDSDQLGYFNILGGSCMSIAVKYASSHDIGAKRTLLHYLDIMMTVSSKVAGNYDQRIAHHSATNIQNMLALCLSVVMAGSGDLDTLRRLRMLHHNTGKDMGYGNYMAINTALGFLFLSGGQYAFSNSNFAVASLITSMYPISPNGNSEYEVHLQALRHFWALSVEPRCLVVRDVNTHKPCKIPVRIQLKDGSIKETLSPCLLPQLDEIVTIRTMSSDYFAVKIDFDLNSEYLDIFKRSLTIFVFKKKNYQMLQSSIGSLLSDENKSLQIDNGEIEISQDLQKVLDMEVFNQTLESHEKKLLLFESSEANNNQQDDSNSSNRGNNHQNTHGIYNIIDDKLELGKMARNPGSVEDLWNLRLIFAYTDRLLAQDLHYISIEFVEQLKQSVFSIGM